PERVRLRQILTESRSDALRARREIEAGADFAAVARRLAHGPKAESGGYQGELARSDLPPAFVDVIFGLRPGEVSQVVPAEYGFHVFQVTERLRQEVVPLAEARGEILEKLRREQADRLLRALVAEGRARYNVTVYERNLPFKYEGSYKDAHFSKSY
ncbi:MAG: peptidylprolyl isomerase, partial [Acidobacteriota bacterium]|nr:peptidylprolyl isomerase [Acidobacteriota bacterium]